MRKIKLTRTNPDLNKLLSMVKDCTLYKKDFPIKNNQYTSARLIMPQFDIYLNKRNGFVSNMEATSHELMHKHYDYDLGLYLPEYEIEQLGLIHLDMIPEYYSALENKIRGIQ